MKLNDMSPRATPKNMNKIFESRFGFTIDFNKLTLPRAQKMAHTIKENLMAIRRSHGIHSAEKNPKYMELLMVNEALSKWIRSRTRLVEGELGQAEVILAAKSMVDTVQDMIEKVGKLQNEELPPLLDTIRDQLGTAQADSFKQAADQALSSLSQQLTTAREGLDQGARALAGEDVASDMMGGGMPGGEPGMGEPGMGDPSMPDPEMDAFAGTDAATGGTTPLGREKR
jgi:hypothetical protein